MSHHSHSDYGVRLLRDGTYSSAKWVGYVADQHAVISQGDQDTRDPIPTGLLSLANVDPLGVSMVGFWVIGTGVAWWGIIQAVSWALS